MIELRRQGLSVHEISARLRAGGTPLNRTGVGQILAEEGFGRLLRGPAPEASASPSTAGRDTRLPRAPVIDLAAFPARAETSLAGLLLVIPDLVALDLPALIRKAGYPGTAAIPPVSRILSLLTLKLTATRGSPTSMTCSPTRPARCSPGCRYCPRSPRSPTTAIGCPTTTSSGSWRPGPQDDHQRARGQ